MEQMVCFQYDGDGKFDEARALGTVGVIENYRTLKDLLDRGPATTNGKTSHIETVTT